MKPTVIKNQADYKAALAQLETLMDAQPDTPQAAKLERLAVFLDNYEREHCPIGWPDPAEAIKFRLEQQALTCKDLPASQESE